jgi:hypothetical protein
MLFALGVPERPLGSRSMTGTIARLTSALGAGQIPSLFVEKFSLQQFENFPVPVRREFVCK